MKSMIAISTGQNTVNLIPAIQLGIDNLVLIETSLATKKKWSEGLLQVLQSREIRTEVLQLNESEDNRIDLIYKILHEKFSKTEEQLLWNIGGGQKTQQMAVWQAFNKLCKIDDFVCYSNPVTKKLEKWYLENDNLIYQEENIDVNISAEEIFQVYGQKVNNTGIQFYQKNKRINLEPVSDLFKYNEFRQYFFSLGGINLTLKNTNSYSVSELRTVIDSLKKDKTLTQQIKEKARRNLNNNVENYSLSVKNFTLDFFKDNLSNNPILEEITLENDNLIQLLNKMGYYNSKIPVDYQIIELLVKKEPKSPANYFEEILVKRTKKLLEKSDDTNFIFEAYANFASASGEYDILLVTTRGTLIALDAKTFDVDKKDSDARLYNLTLSGGQYVDWIPVIPYDPESTKFMSDKLKKLPKTLYDMKKPFFVVSDNYKENYKHNIDTFDIEMKLFDNFLASLELV